MKNNFKLQWFSIGVTFALVLPAGYAYAQTTGTTKKSNAQTQSSTASDTAQKMAFAFQDVPVRALLQVLGETAGVNIVADDSVIGTITLNLKESTWRDAFNVVVKAKGLIVDENGGTIYVKGSSAYDLNGSYTSTATSNNGTYNPTDTTGTYGSTSGTSGTYNPYGTNYPDPYSTSGTYGSPAAGSNYGNAYGSAYGNYGNSYGSAYGNSYGSSYGSSAYGQPPPGMKTDVIELQYQKAENVQEIMSSQTQRFLSPYGVISADKSSNQLIIQDFPEKLEQIRSLVKRIDRPAKQVLIEARIVEAEDTFSRSLGVKLGFNDLRRVSYSYIPNPADPTKVIQSTVSSNGGPVWGGNINSVSDLSGQTSGNRQGVLSTVTNNMINFPATSSTGASPASFAVSLFRSGLSQFINLEVDALETDGKGKVISSPRVVTSNNVTALIEQGTEIPYNQSTSSGATSVSFRKANLKLEVTPQITPNGDVVMKVDVTKDSLGSVLTEAGYTINTKHVQTQVKVENGGTLVIGGIYQEDKRNSADKVPLLGDLPFVGNLFKRTNKERNKSELLIFLTPYILDGQGKLTPAKTNQLTLD